MHRGEVWWAHLPAPVGRRPVVLLSRESAYRVRASITVAPVTRRARRIPTEVALGEPEGMPAACVVNADDIMTVPKDLLRERLTVLSAGKVKALAEAIRFALDL